MSVIPTPWQIGLRVWSQSGSDAHGNAVDTWAAPVVVPIHSVAPRVVGTDEPNRGNRSVVIEGLTVYAPAGTVVDARDRIVWPWPAVAESVEYEVVGEIEDYTKGPWGNPAAGVVIQMQRWEG